MNFEIGQIFEGEYPPEAAAWCNENNAYIEELESITKDVTEKNALGKEVTQTKTLRRFQIKAIPEVSLAELKRAKDEAVKSAYLNYRNNEATVPSSLGFTADANTRAWVDVMGLVTKAQSAPEGEKVTFRASDNTFHEITREQLGTLLLEIIATGEDSYAQKWAMNKAIEAATTKAELDAIDTTFKSPTAPIAVDTHIHAPTGVVEDRLFFKEGMQRFIQDNDGYSALRYTVNDTWSNCPVGFSKDQGDVTLNDKVQVIPGSSATGGEGALVFPNDGTADISVTFRVFNEQKDESLFTAKLVDVTNAGTVTDIKADAVSVKIAGGSVGSIVTLRAKGINIKAKDMIGIQFKSDKKDGCYLQSNSRLNPLVETIVNYKELTK